MSIGSGIQTTAFSSNSLAGNSNKPPTTGNGMYSDQVIGKHYDPIKNS